VQAAARIDSTVKAYAASAAFQISGTLWPCMPKRLNAKLPFMDTTQEIHAGNRHGDIHAFFTRIVRIFALYLSTTIFDNSLRISGLPLQVPPKSAAVVATPIRDQQKYTGQAYKQY
jgi:hypothetical protein